MSETAGSSSSEQRPLQHGFGSGDTQAITKALYNYASSILTKAQAASRESVKQTLLQAGHIECDASGRPVKKSVNLIIKPCEHEIIINLFRQNPPLLQTLFTPAFHYVVSTAIIQMCDSAINPNWKVRCCDVVFEEWGDYCDSHFAESNDSKDFGALLLSNSCSFFLKSYRALVEGSMMSQKIGGFALAQLTASQIQVDQVQTPRSAGGSGIASTSSKSENAAASEQVGPFSGLMEKLEKLDIRVPFGGSVYIYVKNESRKYLAWNQNFCDFNGVDAASLMSCSESKVLWGPKHKYAKARASKIDSKLFKDGLVSQPNIEIFRNAKKDRRRMFVCRFPVRYKKDNSSSCKMGLLGVGVDISNNRHCKSLIKWVKETLRTSVGEVAEQHNKVVLQSHKASTSSSGSKGNNPQSKASSSLDKD